MFSSTAYILTIHFIPADNVRKRWRQNWPIQKPGSRLISARRVAKKLQNWAFNNSWIICVMRVTPEQFGILLGREDFLGSTTIARGSADYSLIPKTFGWAKT